MSFSRGGPSEGEDSTSPSEGENHLGPSEGENHFSGLAHTGV